MDHQRALQRLRSRQILSAAFDYAVFDRQSGDHFFDPIEIRIAISRKDEIIAEIIEELQVFGSYQPRVAFAYFPPKNHLCDRRMIYIPLKDLVVRYAIVLLFSEDIEHEFLDECFANRRARENEQQIRFTEEFATGGWPRFCEWQRTQCNEYAVLIKADISAFYDSISHEYLIDAIERHLSIPRTTPIMELFKKLLQVNVIYYSQATGEISEPSQIHQGLPIGDGVEGYLANIYLKDVDDAMSQIYSSYGRYVDDIRIFGNSREEAIQHLRVLQECLLKLGLNLNSSKTMIAENDDEMAEIRSSNYLLDISMDDEVEDAGISRINQEIDAPFDEFDRIFHEGDEINIRKDGKDFCKYLSSHNPDGTARLPLEQRTVWHVNMLRDFTLLGRGASKHAVWLIIQTALYNGVHPDSQHTARQVLNTLLLEDDACSYAVYRCLHHLLKERGERRFRFLDQLREQEREAIIQRIPQYLSNPAFELNLIAVYLGMIAGMDLNNLRGLVHRHAARSCEPLRNALSTINEFEIRTTPPPPETIEPDETPGRY